MHQRVATPLIAQAHAWHAPALLAVRTVAGSAERAEALRLYAKALPVVTRPFAQAVQASRLRRASLSAAPLLLSAALSTRRAAAMATVLRAVGSKGLLM
ncbi:hypothetical protein T492DRAFT_893127 [Pavlovales sp. CCMP2436]|nr:hypothetical protein T492DRAFT_893127 [Pavlovales sp. CCMP2436]